MNQRNKILIEYWNSKELNEAISKMHPIQLQDDLKSELFLILAELNEEKLIDLYEKKQLRFYVVRIMLNLIHSTDKKFYQKYRNFVEYDEQEKADVQQEDISEDVAKIFEDLYWYQREIMRLYVYKFNRNAKELSRQTGIPYISIVRTINQTKTELKKKIRK